MTEWKSGSHLHENIFVLILVRDLDVNFVVICTKQIESWYSADIFKNQILSGFARKERLPGLE